MWITSIRLLLLSKLKRLVRLCTVRGWKTFKIIHFFFVFFCFTGLFAGYHWVRTVPRKSFPQKDEPSRIADARFLRVGWPFCHQQTVSKHSGDRKKTWSVQTILFQQFCPSVCPSRCGIASRWMHLRLPGPLIGASLTGAPSPTATSSAGALNVWDGIFLRFSI